MDVSHQTEHNQVTGISKSEHSGSPTFKPAQTAVAHVNRLSAKYPDEPLFKRVQLACLVSADRIHVIPNSIAALPATANPMPAGESTQRHRQRYHYA